MKKKPFIVAGVSAWLFLAASAPLAWALTVSPARTEVRVSPGEVARAVLTVTNSHTEPYDVELSEKPWFIYPENRTIHVDQWLELPDPKEFRLEPGKSREVKITIRCPKDAVGELMGMVSFTYQGEQPSMITPMISTAVYLRVKGTEKNQGEILALGAGTQHGHFQVGAQIKATGNVRLRPTGTIRLLSDKGQVVSTYTVPEPNPIFPGTVADCIGRGPYDPPPAGRYTLSAELRSESLELKGKQELMIKSDGAVELVKEPKKS